MFCFNVAVEKKAAAPGRVAQKNFSSTPATPSEERLCGTVRPDRAYRNRLARNRATARSGSTAWMSGLEPFDFNKLWDVPPAHVSSLLRKSNDNCVMFANTVRC